MKCSYCGAELLSGSKFCGECGKAVSLQSTADPAVREKQLQMAGSASAALGKAARQARLTASYSEDEIISERAYNAVMILVILWGLVVNVFLCTRVGDVYRYINPALFLVLYLVSCIAGIMIAHRSKNPAVSFLGYNLVVVPLGLVISTLVAMYGDISAVVVKDAFIYTSLITFGMLALEMIRPQLFAKLGGALLGCLTGLIICELILLLFHVRQEMTDWIAAGLFSLYIGYDIYRSQQFPKTVDNAVDCAIDIYLDVANLFIRILSILAKSKKND